MKTYKIRLNTIDLVKSFSNLIHKDNIHADLHCGSYSVDAQSILGILTLNLTSDLDLVVRSYMNNEEIEEFEKSLQPYIVE